MPTPTTQVHSRRGQDTERVEENEDSAGPQARQGHANIAESYRPICIGSLPMKALEKVAQGWVLEAEEKRPLHPSIMAYKKGIGHEMAVFAGAEAALHAKLGLPRPKN